MVADADTGQQGIADHVDLNHVGGAGDADGNTGGDDDEVAVLHKTRALGLRNRHTDELIRGSRVVHQQRGNAAVDVQLAAGSFIQHTGDNLGVRTEAAQQAGGLTALGSVMMAEAPMSVAVVQAAWPTAALMFRRLLSVPEWWTRLSKLESARWSRQS